MVSLVVPMDPEFLPEAALLIGALFALGAAIHFLFRRELRQAVKAGSAVALCLALTFVSAKALHRDREAPGLSPAREDSMTLVLGDVVLRTAPADRYKLSVDGTPFLEIDTKRSGLAVSCVIGAHGTAAAGIERNLLPFRWTEVRPANPDPHTLVVTQRGEDIFRLRYSEPRRIEVTGQFFERSAARAALISLQTGIRWKGGSFDPGSMIDLTSQGPGAIDFDESGAIRVIPKS